MPDINEYCRDKVQQNHFDKGKFGGSITSVQEDIVTMVALNSVKRKLVETDNETNKKGKFILREPPPSVIHSSDSSGTKCKLDDKKTFNGETFYYYDCPGHQNSLKWHTHEPNDYCTIIHWLKQKGSDTHTAATTTNAITYTAGSSDTATESSNISRITSSLTDGLPNLQVVLTPTMKYGNIQRGGKMYDYRCPQCNC